MSDCGDQNKRTQESPSLDWKIRSILGNLMVHNELCSFIVKTRGNWYYMRRFEGTVKSIKLLERLMAMEMGCLKS